METRGRIAASLADFRRLAHDSLNDPRGWRITGIAFKEVRSGGSMTLVLAEASRVPAFSSVCSSDWSCRVGRYVIINQKRWRFASPAWNRYGGSLRDYRHMVVNHETGHWLGHGHRSCPAGGALRARDAAAVDLARRLPVQPVPDEAGVVHPEVLDPMQRP